MKQDQPPATTEPARRATATFAELTKDCTPAECDALAWQLGLIRMRATFETLRHRAELEEALQNG